MTCNIYTVNSGIIFEPPKERQFGSKNQEFEKSIAASNDTWFTLTVKNNDYYSIVSLRVMGSCFFSTKGRSFDQVIVDSWLCKMALNDRFATYVVVKMCGNTISWTCYLHTEVHVDKTDFRWLQNFQISRNWMYISERKWRISSIEVLGVSKNQWFETVGVKLQCWTKVNPRQMTFG